MTITVESKRLSKSQTIQTTSIIIEEKQQKENTLIPDYEYSDEDE
jgi:hypothetical protein